MNGSPLPRTPLRIFLLYSAGIQGEPGGGPLKNWYCDCLIVAQLFFLWFGKIDSSIALETSWIVFLVGDEVAQEPQSGRPYSSPGCSDESDSESSRNPGWAAAT